MNSDRLRTLLSITALAALIFAPGTTAQRRRERLPNFWINDNMQRGFDLAKKTEKPLLIVFRCPP